MGHMPRLIHLRASAAAVVVLAVALIDAPMAEPQSLQAPQARQGPGTRDVSDGVGAAAGPPTTVSGVQAGGIRQWVESVRFDVAPGVISNSGGLTGSSVSTSAVERGYYRGRRGGDRGLAGLILGAIGGAAAGGAIGVAVSEHSCNCDNPALHGFIIGAPIGAFCGGVIGYAIAR